MGIIKDFLRDYGYVHKSDLKRRGSRAYAAAKMNRLTADWVNTSTSIDNDIRSGLVAVRARARDLSQNNEYARAYLRAVKKNVVGSEGFKLQVKAKSFSTVNGTTKAVPDRMANSMLEDAFKEWSKPEYATVTGKHSFRKVEELVVETAARDGEMFVRILRGEKVNRFGFTLEMLEPDWIDEKYSEEMKNGNLVRMGVEFDRWRKPVAYYVSTRNPILELYGPMVPSGQRTRIPAGDIIHVYDPERSDQSRGMPWMAPAMLGLHNLSGYVEGAIINARAGANKMGFFRDPDGSGEGYTGDTADSDGNKIATCEPGTFEDIGRKEFVGFDPKYPDQQFDPFVKSILRGISSGLGVSFSSLSNDLTEVNFSSIRAGLIEERESWKSVQSWFIETFLNRVYSEWLLMALTTSAVNLPISKYQKFNAPSWTGRRWAWVDPLKEVQAYKQAIGAGLKSATRVIAEDGGDIEELYQEISDEKDLAKQYGLDPDYGGKSDAGKGTAEDPEEGPSAEDVPARPGNGKGNGKDDRPRLLV